MKNIRHFAQGLQGKIIIASVAALVVFGAGYFVLRSAAGGYFAAFDPDAGTITGNAQSVDDPTALGGKAVRFLAGSTPPPTTPPPTDPPTTPPPTTPPPTTGTTTCPLPAYPSAACTGVRAGTSLTQISGDYYTKTNGEIIEGKRITGDIVINHNNVIIRNSEVYGHIKNDRGVNETFVVEDSTVGPPSGCLSDAAIGISHFTVNRVYLRNYAEGVRAEWLDESNPSLSLVGQIMVKDSYFKFCNPGVDNHGDAIQGYHGGPNVSFIHNTVDMQAIPQSVDYITSAVFWSDGSADGFIVKDNLLHGRGITIYIQEGKNHIITGNKVVDGSWKWQPAHVRLGCNTVTWSNNSIVEIDSSYNITRTVGPLNCTAN